MGWIGEEQNLQLVVPMVTAQLNQTYKNLFLYFFNIFYADVDFIKLPECDDIKTNDARLRETFAGEFEENVYMLTVSKARGCL